MIEPVKVSSTLCAGFPYSPSENTPGHSKGLAMNWCHVPQ